MDKTYEIQLVRTKIADVTETFNNPQAVARYCGYMSRFDREHLVRLDLDTRCQLVSRETVHIGTADACVVGPSEVFRGALLRGARQIVVVHNHPSGQAEPSDEDRCIAEALQKAGKLLGVALADFVIIGDCGRYWSWRSGSAGKVHGKCTSSPPARFDMMVEYRPT